MWSMHTENGRIIIRCEKDQKAGLKQYFVSVMEWLRVLSNIKELTVRINDLTNAVTALQASEAKVKDLVATQTQQIAALQSQVSQSGLSAEDQAALDKAVSDIQVTTADLDSIVNPPAPA